MPKRDIGPEESDQEALSGLEKRRKMNGNDAQSLTAETTLKGLALARDAYTVGWICAITNEYVAARAFLDEEHGRPRYVAPHDNNEYTLGRVGNHNVVIAVLPDGEYGTVSAASVARDMLHSFPNLRIRLMVGIGGGAPSPKHDIRLGDVVVSTPCDGKSGVFQYDFGKAIHGEGFRATGFLNQPPKVLRAAVSGLKAQYEAQGHFLDESINIVLKKMQRLGTKYKRPELERDRLYRTAIVHPPDEEANCAVVCGDDPSKLITRAERKQGEDNPTIHYGLIASGNQLMKDALVRDRLASEYNVLCFEMEAAGLMDDFPCLVIRGVCDYSDSHKNKEWQGYAAMAAAAYAKDLLGRIPSSEIQAEKWIAGSSESLNDERKQVLLDSLRFDQIDARQMTIKNAHTQTCKWLLQDPQYIDWLEHSKLCEHHGFLWIRGKPGAGKSTLMKFALINTRKNMMDKIVISFFFNARGDNLEKSTIGMYQSLLLQLLERCPELQAVLDSLGLVTRSGGPRQWSVESLKDLFEQAILRLGKSSVLCFIDALDECDENQIRDMVSFFEHVGEMTATANIGFLVCFSSRHYPYITLEKGLNLVLEGQEGHSRDIICYLDGKLKIGHSKLAKQIRIDVQEKASGVFLWVVLVVEMLNKEYDRGRIYALRKKVQDIPGDLHELFRDILTRDKDIRDELLLCIQWVLFARQPLRPEQLYYAILAGVEPDALSRWDSEEITASVIKRYIVDSSKGLVEVTRTKNPTAQFIHESVRDFLLKENGLKEIWLDLERNFQGESHERLKHCCLNYISIDIYTNLNIDSSLPKASSQQAAELRQSADKAFPFYEYAVRNVLYHADAAEGGGVKQTGFLEGFRLIDWIMLDNLFERHEVRRHTPKDNNSRTPLLWAAKKGHKGVTELLLKAGANANFKDINNRGPLSWAAERGHEGVAELLLEAGANTEFKDVKRRTPLLWAVAGGRETVTIPLLTTGKVNAGSKDENDCTSQEEGRQNHALQDYQMQLMLLEQQNKKRLMMARGERQAVVKLLLDKNADAEAKDNDGRTPLSWATENESKTVLELLLKKGANVEAKDNNGRTPLSRACENRLEAAVKMLLNKSADIEAKDNNGRTPLSWAADNGSKAVIELLLKKGANVDAKDNKGRTPLLWATEKGHEAIVKLLQRQA